MRKLFGKINDFWLATLITLICIVLACFLVVGCAEGQQRLPNETTLVSRNSEDSVTFYYPNGTTEELRNYRVFCVTTSGLHYQLENDPEDQWRTFQGTFKTNRK